MKKLNELYDCIYDIEIKGIKINSKEVESGDLFICTMGVNADRHDFVLDAIHNGAVAIVASRKIDVLVPVIYVENTNQELPRLMAKFCDYPESKLSIIGITGTNGKTTVAEMIQDLLGSDICGYIGTNGIDCKSFHQSIRNTTPDADRLYPYLKKFVDFNCKYLSMETSSEAFYRHRLDGISFDVSVLTTMAQDHLNIHKTMENYVASKCQLFEKTAKGGTSILNRDDKYYETFLASCREKVLSYGYHKDADLKIINTVLKPDCTAITFQFEGKEYSIESPFLASFNVTNLCASLLATFATGIKMDEVVKRIPNLKPIVGRVESLSFQQPYQIILDYAHTIDSLSNVLTFLNQIKKGRIITVTGSAGGREKEKRPGMGKVVLENSDVVIFTMDDPRDENVDDIIDQMLSTSTNTNYERINDRPEAIKRALDLAQEDDIVFIAGKGRDNYMAIGTEYLPYSDYDEIEKYFTTKKGI